MPRSLAIFSIIIVCITGCNQNNNINNIPKRLQDRWSPAGFRCLNSDRINFNGNKIIISFLNPESTDNVSNTISFTIKSFHGNEISGEIEATNDAFYSDKFYNFFPAARNAKNVSIIFKYDYDLVKVTNVIINGKKFDATKSPYRAWTSEDCYEGKYPKIYSWQNTNDKYGEAKESSQLRNDEIKIRGRK